MFGNHKPGDVVYHHEYRGICHLCGSPVEYEGVMPGIYIGAYADIDGRIYYLFTPLLWWQCKACKGIFDSFWIWQDLTIQRLKEIGYDENSLQEYFNCT